MNLKALDKRYKLLFIPYHLVLGSVEYGVNADARSALRNPREAGSEEIMAFEPLQRVLQQLPHDTEVQGCHLSDTRKGLLFHLWHESFDIVEQSEEIPEIKWEVQNADIPDAVADFFNR